MKIPEKPSYERILAAVDFKPLEGSEEEEALNQEILNEASSVALSDSASLHLVHARETFAGKYIRSRGRQNS